MTEALGPRRWEKDTTRRSLEPGRALTGCEPVEATKVEGLAGTESAESDESRAIGASIDQHGLTTSFDNRISTHSVVDSQTSRNKTFTASARASASSADVISKRNTRSPPYRANKVAGGLGMVESFPVDFLRGSSEGMRQMACMTLFLVREYHDVLSLLVEDWAGS